MILQDCADCTRLSYKTVRIERGNLPRLCGLCNMILQDYADRTRESYMTLTRLNGLQKTTLQYCADRAS